MSITRSAIEKNRITAIGLLVVILAGYSAYQTIPRAEDPGFTVRTALVITRLPGASPERIEELVTDKVEKALQEIPEVDYLRSESKTGVSIVYVNVQERFTAMRPIWDDVRRKAERAAADLPEGTIGPLVNDEFGDVYGIVLTLTGEGYSFQELQEVADRARDEFLALDMAAKVSISGGQDERIFVEYSNARLADLGLTPSILSAALEAQNIVIPGGNITIGPERLALEPSGNYESLEDLRQTVLTLPGQSEPVYLQDIATISRGYVDPPRTMVFAGGEPALALGISLVDGGNIELLGQQVREVFDRLTRDYPIGLEMEVLAFQPDVVTRKVDDFVGNLVQAIAIVVGVMLVSLGLRTGVLVAALIPMTMIATILIMSSVGIGLDQVSLAALIIALGMLVDNAIVMSESIMVQMQQGKDRLAAAVESANELRVPLLISSLTTAAAFLPIALAQSTTGEYTRSIFFVVTIALLSSWVLALTMTPLLCYLFLKVGHASENDETFDTRTYRLYRRFLLTLLRRKYATLLAVVVLFVGSLALFRFVPKAFFPPSERPVVLGDISLPVGTDIRETGRVMVSVQDFVRDSLVGPGGVVTDWAVWVGEGPPKFRLSFNPEPASPEYGFIFLNTANGEVRQEVVDRLDAFVFRTVPDASATFQTISEGPPVRAPIEVRLSSRDSDALFTAVADLKGMLEREEGFTTVTDDWGPQAKKLVVSVNEPRARRAGLTNRDIAVSLQASLSGVQTTEFREDEDVIPVIMRSVIADREDLGKLESLNVLSQFSGRSVPLKQVADVTLEWEPAKVIRRDGVRTVTLSSFLEGGLSATEANARVVPYVESRLGEWGDVAYALGGEVEASQSANRAIAAQLPLAGFIIVILLVGQFNSLRRAAIVLATIPLGLIGVILGLLAFRSYFGFMTLLGIISLAGIVINNAIVLLDRIRIEEEEVGRDPAAAVVEAAQRRMRPILLTTATTIGGLIPLYLGGGLMWEPMAVAIMAGLAFATLLTLGFVPVLYAILFRVPFESYRYASTGAQG